MPPLANDSTIVMMSMATITATVATLAPSTASNRPKIVDEQGPENGQSPKYVACKASEEERGVVRVRWTREVGHGSGNHDRSGNGKLVVSRMMRQC
jgi:hypothetical protein